MKHLLSCSILSADFARLGEETASVIAAGVDSVHFDVMDNHYVPNLSIGPMVLRSLRDYGITAPIEVHLMVSPVDEIIPEFARAGASIIAFHPETSANINKALTLIKQHDCQAGLVLNPDTPVDKIQSFISQLDVIVLMSVCPGFGGQSFLPRTFLKIRQIRKLINSLGYNNIALEVDGGVNVNNIRAIATSGADILVIGSAIFSQSKNNYKQVINSMRAELSKYRAINLPN
ncbi:MAG: ribulose-phosphate 3-epimerase [Candidatus Dasytiphilus stammeri]